MKHNWFAVDCDIRTNTPMTPREFIKLLESLGLEILGNIKHAPITDDDYK